ncbi:Intracellular LEctin, partial [Trichostrongylus colubriformis]
LRSRFIVIGVFFLCKRSFNRSRSEAKRDRRRKPYFCQPVWSRDWELQVSIKITGSTGDLFGDGMAIWYVSEPNQMGPVFGGKDYFRGLAVFLDTYSNHNGPHTHRHPYISAMVSDGSLHYDHDRDGTHTQLGGENTGCEAKFRNKDYETQILLRYVDDTLSMCKPNVYIWCFVQIQFKNVCTSGYSNYVSDTHGVVAVKMFEQEFARVNRADETNRKDIVPQAGFRAAPRDHVDDPQPSRLGWLGSFLLVVIGIIVVCIGVRYGIVYIRKGSERQRKRFY